MNRHKFRIWSKQHERMLTQEEMTRLSIYDAFRSGHYITMQWIGEKDSTYRDIYEGDIIETQYCGKRYLYSVFCKLDMSMAFDTKPIDMTRRVRPYMNYGTSKSTTIKGNIYDNSDIYKSVLGGGRRYDGSEEAMNRYHFRAWHEEKKIMLSWAELIEGSLEQSRNAFTMGDIFYSKIYLPMQGTKVTDSMDRMIYEGDIVTYEKIKDQCPYIVFRLNSAGFLGWAVLPDKGPITPGERDLGKGHIIGNTKENPDIARYNTLEDIYNIYELRRKKRDN